MASLLSHYGPYISIAKGLFSGVSGQFLRGRIFQSPTGRYKPGCLCLECSKESWQGSWALICRLLLKILFFLLHFPSPFSLLVSCLVHISPEGWSPGWESWEWRCEVSVFPFTDFPIIFLLLTFTQPCLSRCWCLQFLSHMEIEWIKLAYFWPGTYLCRHLDLPSLCSAVMYHSSIWFPHWYNVVWGYRCFLDSKMKFKFLFLVLHVREEGIGNVFKEEVIRTFMPNWRKLLFSPSLVVLQSQFKHSMSSFAICW